MARRNLSTRAKRRELIADQAAEILDDGLGSKAEEVSKQLKESLDSVRGELSGIRSAIRWIGFLMIAATLFLSYALTR